MDNQENLIQEKILKREKTDTILAYIMLIIVLLAIGFIIYLKFIAKEEIAAPVEQKNDNITLNYISNELNNSTYLSKYTGDNSEFTSASNEKGLVINYKNNDSIKTININTVGNELEVKITDEDKNFITDIYKEITNIICKYYGNSDGLCKSVIDKIDETTELEGIRFVTVDNQSYVYLDTTRSIDVNDIQIYSEVTNVDINNKNYQLKLNDIIIKNIDVINSDESIDFTGTVKGENLNTKSIVVSLYNENNELIISNKYTMENESTNKFNVSFNYDSNLTYDLIKKYSISIE